jgi:hypothetical protein
MSIKFICSCGKHLRARDEMAARRSVCPRCGEPVGIPSLQPTHPGIFAAPLTPQERRRLRGEPSRDHQEAEQASLPDGRGSDVPPKQARTPRLRRRRQLETRWTECLIYPFLSWRLLLILALMLTVLSACLVLLLPEMPRFSEMSRKEWLPYSPCLLVPLLIVAYTCGTLECALRSALAGEGPGAYWPGWYMKDALKSCLRWLFCFLAGPIVLIALAGYYWLYGGELTRLDWFILAELGTLAIAYWLLAIVTANESDRLRDANPLRVTQLFLRLRFRAIVPVLVVPALVFVHSLVALFALPELHRHTVLGWPMLLICWCSALFWATFLLRWLGVWCYRNPL